MAAEKLKAHLVDMGAGVFVIAAVLYFGHLGVQGSLGLRAGKAAQLEEQRLTAELRSLQVEHARLNNLTHRLSDSYLDLDLLDERARDILGYIREDEIVVR